MTAAQRLGNLADVVRKLSSIEEQLNRIDAILHGDPKDNSGNRKGLIKRVNEVEQESAVTLAAVMNSQN